MAENIRLYPSDLLVSSPFVYLQPDASQVSHPDYIRLHIRILDPPAANKEIL